MSSPTPPRRGLRPGSIRAKLVAAFAAIVALVFVALVASETAFNALDRQLEEFQQSTLPQTLALQAMEADLVGLGTVATRADQARDGEDLEQRVDDFGRLLRELRAQAAEFDSTGGGFGAIVDRLEEQAGVLFELRRRSLDTSARLRSRASALTGNIQGLADDLEAEAILLQAGGRGAAPVQDLRLALLSMSDVVRALVETDPRTAESTAPAQRSRFDPAMRKAVRLLRGLAEPSRGRIGQDLNGIIEGATGAGGLFELQAEVIQLTGETARASADTDEVLVEFSRRGEELAGASAARVNEGRARSKASLSRSRWFVRGLFLAVLAISAWISFVYVNRRIGGRLARLVGDVTEISRGNLDVEIERGGDEEVAQLAAAAEVFRRNARALEHTLADLERKNAALTEFAYVSSHDLKSPMRAISNLSAWVLEDAEDVLPEESAEHLRLIKQRTDRLETLLEDLLRYARAGNVEAERVDVRLDELIRDVVELLALPEAAEVHVIGGDFEVALQQVPFELVMRNLIQNAVVHHDGARQQVWIEALREPDGTLRITVEDDGPGIPERSREEAFRIFRRVGTTEAGTGMGLALVRRAVEGVGGTVILTGREPRGARFEIEWPLVAVGSA